MTKENVTPNAEAVKNLRDLYNKKRKETLKNAKENAEKLPKPKKDERVAKPRPKSTDLDL